MRAEATKRRQRTLLKFHNVAPLLKLVFSIASAAMLYSDNLAELLCSIIYAYETPVSEAMLKTNYE